MTEEYEGPEGAQENLLPKPGTTGRFVITLEPTKAQQGLDVLRQIGIEPNTIVEGAEGVDPNQLNEQKANIYFKSLGIVVVGCLSQEQLEQIRAAAEAKTAVLSVESEPINEVLSFP